MRKTPSASSLWRRALLLSTPSFHTTTSAGASRLFLLLPFCSRGFATHLTPLTRLPSRHPTKARWQGQQPPPKPEAQPLIPPAPSHSTVSTGTEALTKEEEEEKEKEEPAATTVEVLEVEVMAPSPHPSHAVDSSTAAAAAAAAPPLRARSGERETVRSLDAFSKAKVINFVKRLLAAPPEEGRQGVLGLDASEASGAALPLIETREIASNDPDSGDGVSPTGGFYARVRLPLPVETYGEQLYGLGFAPTEREAEMAACMHAERIIDALGFPIFQLSSKQNRHAEAAAAAGRWAPQAGATPLPPSEALARLPIPPIQYVNKGGATAKVEQQMQLDKLNFTAVRRGAFTPMRHTLVSAYFFDGGSVPRVKQFLFAYKSSLERCCKVTALHKEAAKMMGSNSSHSSSSNPAAIPAVFLAQLRLPIDARYGERVCHGKAPTRREAIALACMHAELTIDALGLTLFPQSPDDQAQHAKECRQVNRWCVEPGEFDFRYQVPTPPPLELDSEREIAAASSALASSRTVGLASPHSTTTTSSSSSAAAGGGGEAAGSSFTQKGTTTSSSSGVAATAEVLGGGEGGESDELPSIESVLVQHSRAVNNMHGVLNVTTVEPSARRHLLTYLGECRPSHDPAEEQRSPFFVESLGQRQQETYRATVSVPLRQSGRRESFVAIGISDNSEDAEAAAAMHALHTLSALNQPWWTPEKQAMEPGNTSGFPASLAAYAKMAGWRCYDPAQPSRSLADVAEHQLPPPIRCLGAHVGRISASGLSADWRRRGQRLHRPSGHFFAEVEDRASDIISNEENTAREILQLRQKLPKPDWSVEPDAAHRILVPPEASTSGRNYVHTLPAVRQPDLFAVQRLRDYLERHGKNFDSSLAVAQEAVDDPPGCTLWVSRVQLPLPLKLQTAVGVVEGPLARCIAQGESFQESDALCLCAMHAELLLDAMGVPFYDHPLLQRKHADTARMLGRWAPLRLGMRPPMALAALPPPLRRAHPKSQRGAASHSPPPMHQSSRSTTATNPPQADAKAANLRSTAEALKRLQQQQQKSSGKSGAAVAGGKSKSFQRREGLPEEEASPPPPSPSAATSGGVQTDDELCDIHRLQPIHSREVFRQAFKHVQFYFNSKGTDFFRTLRQYTVRDEQHGVVHRAIVEIPLPDGFGKRYAVGCAAAKKMAPLLCASHVAWTLDALGVPIYHGKRQQFYATLAKEVGRKAPFPGDPRQPWDTPSPKGLCCLTSASRELPEPPTEPSAEALRRDRRLWMQYLRACRTYIEKKREYDLLEALFEFKKAPRWEIAAEDDALDAVELLPLNRQVRLQLPSLCKAAGLPPPELFRYEVYGKLPQRMYLTEVPVLGTPYTARGVGLGGSDSTHRAAMHYAYLVTQVVMQNHGADTDPTLAHRFATNALGLPFSAAGSHATAAPSSSSSSSSAAAAASSSLHPGGTASTRVPRHHSHLFDVAKADFTPAGKWVLLELFAAIKAPHRPLQWNVKWRPLPSSPPPPQQQQQGGGKGEAGKRVVAVTVEWVDATEVRHAGRCEHRGGLQEAAADGAMADLFQTLQRNASFQALVAFARRRREVHLETLYVLENQTSAEALVEIVARRTADREWTDAQKEANDDAEVLVALPASSSFRWRQRVQPSAAASAALWLQSGASQLLIHALLSVCETSARPAAGDVGCAADRETEPLLPQSHSAQALQRLGLVQPRDPESSPSLTVTPLGTAVGLLVQCLPPVPPPPHAPPSLSGAGESPAKREGPATADPWKEALWKAQEPEPAVAEEQMTAETIQFRHGALLPLQFGKLLYASMVWGCLEEVIQLIAVVAAGRGVFAEGVQPQQRGAVRRAPTEKEEEEEAMTTSSSSVVRAAEAEVEEREHVDVVTLTLEYLQTGRHSPLHSGAGNPEMRQYAADLKAQLRALQQYLLCAFSLEEKVQGGLLRLLSRSLAQADSTSATPLHRSAGAASSVRPHHHHTPAEVESLLRVCVAYATQPSVRPLTAPDTHPPPPHSTAVVQASFDAELQVVRLPVHSSEGEGRGGSGGLLERSWALTSATPVSVYVLLTPPSSASSPFVGAVTPLEDVPELAVVQHTLLLRFTVGESASMGEAWMDALTTLHRTLRDVYVTGAVIPLSIREKLLRLIGALPIRAHPLPPPSSHPVVAV